MNLEVLQDSLKYMSEVFKRSATEVNVADLQRKTSLSKTRIKLTS